MCIGTALYSNQEVLMTIEDIERYKIRYNIDKKCREEYYIYNRMYLYAILFHIHKLSLAKIGKMFKTDHANVRNALIEATKVQHNGKFQMEVQLLYDQYYFIIPEYVNTFKSRAKNRTATKDEYIIKKKVTKKEYFKFLESKDPHIVYQMLWDLTVKTLKL